MTAITGSQVPPSAQRVRFDVFEADLRTGELHRNGRKVRLPNQSFVVLAMLVARRGDLVTRDELRASLWPDGTTVEYEQGLNAAVNRLRDALGDSASRPRFIETLPRRGYRFIGAIESAELPPPPPVVPAPPDIPQRLRSWLPWLGVAALAAVAVVMNVSRENAVAVETFASRPVTSLLGEEVAPSFSPDGNHVVFGWSGEDGRGFDLYVKAVQSDEMLRLTHHPAKWVSPAWSPDGTRMVFMRSGQGVGGLFMIPALGGNERRLTEEAASPGPFAQVDWSPDGRVVPYAALDLSGAHILRLLALDDLTSHSVLPDVGCTDAGLPAFSSDGRRLAFVCATSVAVYSVYVFDRATGTSAEWASMKGYPSGLTWAARDQGLIVANDGGEGGRLWSVTWPGTVSRLPFDDGAAAPAVSDVSGRMVYVRGWRNADVWRVDLAASLPELPASRLVASSRVDMMPRYSPDGSRLAFQSSRTGAEEIWVSNADGSNPVRVTSSDGPLVGAPAWCADGRRLAFDSRASGAAAIYVATIGGGVPTPVETTEPNLSIPAWSSDCRWIFASNGRSELFRIPAEGGPAERFTGRPSYFAQVAGERVIFNVKTPVGVELWVRAVDGGEERPLERMPPLRYDDSWVASSTGIYFVTSATGQPVVHFYDFASSVTHRIGSIAIAPMPLGGLGLSVSPDQAWLVLGHVNDAQSDIVLAEPGRER